MAKTDSFGGSIGQSCRRLEFVTVHKVGMQQELQEQRRAGPVNVIVRRNHLAPPFATAYHT